MGVQRKRKTKQNLFLTYSIGMSRLQLTSHNCHCGKESPGEGRRIMMDRQRELQYSLTFPFSLCRLAWRGFWIPPFWALSFPSHTRRRKKGGVLNLSSETVKKKCPSIHDKASFPLQVPHKSTGKGLSWDWSECHQVLKAGSLDSPCLASGISQELLGPATAIMKGLHRHPEGCLSCAPDHQH